MAEKKPTKPAKKGPPRTKSTKGVHPTRTTRATPKFLLAIPPKLRTALDAEAEGRHQSLTGYLLWLVETHPGRKS